MSKLRTQGVALLATASGLGLVITGCGSNESVCGSGPANWTLTALTSPSDRQLTDRLARGVTRQVAAAASDSCAQLATGIGGQRPAADLDLARIELTPKRDSAPNRAPWIAELEEQAQAHLHRHFLRPLRGTEPTEGSPLLGTLAAIAEQYSAWGQAPDCIVLLSDGLAIEPGPGGRIDLTRPAPDLRMRLAAWKEELSSLRGAHVLVVGAGGDSPFSAAVLSRAREAVEYALRQAGARLTWSRSAEIPPCPGDADE